MSSAPAERNQSPACGSNGDANGRSQAATALESAYSGNCAGGRTDEVVSSVAGWAVFCAESAPVESQGRDRVDGAVDRERIAEVVLPPAADVAVGAEVVLQEVVLDDDAARVAALAVRVLLGL